ncbi:MAG: MFS transporter [Flavobacteriaceae bacterium]|nr:MFS transporter [Flavobacteriaceae bacterium]
MNLQKKETAPLYRIILVILAGESIFILPFVLARIFLPTFLDVFNVTNENLGYCFSVYGLVALFSYLNGGTIADKFPPKKLISGGLLLTAIGGLFMSTFPSYTSLIALFGYWGFTTIFLFWGAMIKATRSWGGLKNQGKAFGFLEGGRGFVAASMGAIGVFIFSLFLPENIESASLIQRQEAFRYVILTSSFLVILISIAVYLFLKEENTTDETFVKSSPLKNIKSVAGIPSVWLLMVIVLCAYVGYKTTDIFSLYASDVMLFNDVEAAEIGTFQLYLRPIVCIAIGLLADRTKGSLWMILGFIIMLMGSIIFSSGIVTSELNTIFFFSLIITAVGTYAIRTLYFAVLQEGKIPLAVTGTAVGLISLVGYTPDIFIGPIRGYLLDQNPGIIGHQHVFFMLAIFSLIGLIASWRFSKLSSSN